MKKATAILLNQYRVSLLVLILVSASPRVMAQINLSNSSNTYSQNFSSLGTTAIATWVNNSTIAGWYAAGSTGVIVNNGSLSTGSLTNFGTTSAADRAFGSTASNGTGTLNYGVQITNTGTSNIKSLQVTYTGEQWRNGGNTVAQKLSFDYATSFTSITAGTYTAITSLDFTSLINTATAATLDGNAAANRTTNITATISGLNIAPGASIMLRWTDVNDAANDHGMAIDDVNIIAVYPPPVVSAFSPSSGAVGSSVTITGSGFNATASNNIVFFGATKAAVTAASSTSLTVTVPAGATYQNISVTNLAGNLTGYSASPFIVTLNGNISFSAKQDFATAANVRNINTGDIDGDGKSDLIVTNFNSNTVSVFRNTAVSGSVSFAPKVDFTTGTNAYFVAVGDIDGDGKQDLAVSNNAGSSVSVLRNTSVPGTVSFAAKVDFTTGSFPNSVSIGDIDGDGKPELVIPSNTNVIAVLRNTSTAGNISFATKFDLATGTFIAVAAIGDIDGDGKPDISVGNTNANSISVFRSTSTAGAISFAGRVDFGVGANPQYISMADIDSDGKADLFSANYTGSTVSVLRNTATPGTISFAANTEFAITQGCLFAKAGDIDGDGKPDIAVANADAGSLSVLRNTSAPGTVSFAANADFPTGGSPFALTIGDLDGDGKPDLSSLNVGSASISVLRQSPPPPVITAFSPLSGITGSSVTITGSGFNTTASSNIVFFGATKAAVTAAGATSLTVTVPVGATFQNIAVTNLASNLTAYSSKPFSVTFPGNISFAPKQDQATGTNPESVRIADIDGDGKTDVLVVNQADNTVSVLRNTSVSGTLNFAAKADFSTGASPESLGIGDIDGDGKPDLATVNANSSSVSVLRNTSASGTISFATKVDFATTGTGALSLGIADIDLDGRPDIIVANSTGNTVSVFRNSSSAGSISFEAKIDFTTGANPYAVSVSDIDGDGKPDLALTNYSANTVSILRNTSVSGTVSFAVKTDLPAGSGPFNISTGDIDADGKPDLAVANLNNNTVSVFRNTSSTGSVSFAARVNFATGTSPGFVSIGDIDGDGKQDLSVANNASNSISILQNTSVPGTVNFATKVDFAVSITANSVAVGDIDGDGKPDVTVANYSSNTVSVLRQVLPAAPVITSISPLSGVAGSNITITGTGFNATASNNIVFFGATKAAVTAASTTNLTVTVPPGSTYQNISVTNLANNLTAYSSQNFVVTLAGSISFLEKQDKTIGFTPNEVVINDFDGDSKPDLAVSNGNSNTVSVFRNTTAGGIYNLTQGTDLVTGAYPQYICAGDLDGDGKADLITPNISDNSLSVFRNNSVSGSINFSAKTDFVTGVQPASACIRDVDGDGKPDVVVANLGSNTVSVFLNTSVAGAISFAAKLDFATGNSPLSVAMNDIDGDGKTDLVVTNYLNNSLSVFRNTAVLGNISFAGKIDFTTGIEPQSVRIGDVDGDGKPDLAVANFNGNSVSVLRNISSAGTINFDAKADFPTGNAPTSVSIGDIDGDGKPDLAVSNSSSNMVSVFRNLSTTGIVNYATKVDFTAGSTPLAVAIGDLNEDNKPDLAFVNSSSGTLSVSLQGELPQGSLTANGPFCISGTGQLTWTATAGVGPFTLVYNDGIANRTKTGVGSGIPFTVFTNPVISTTGYTLVSVTGSDNSVRVGGFTAGSASVIINPATSITAEPSPSSQSVFINASPASVTLSATVTAPVTYQWYNNGSTNSNTGGTIVTAGTGGNTNTYSPPAAAVLGTTYYYCVVTGACGVPVSSAAIAVNVISSLNSWKQGNATSNWNTASNWSLNQVPTGSTDALIPAANSPYPVLSAPSSVNNLTIDPTATVALNGNTLTVNGTVTGTGTLSGSATSGLVTNATTTLRFTSGANTLKNLNVNAGTTTLANALDITAGTALNTYGTVTVANGATLASNGNLNIKSNQFGTARVAANTSGVNYITGDVTVDRYIPQNASRSWRLLSVPTKGTKTIKQTWQENQAAGANGLPGFGTQITGNLATLPIIQAAGFDAFSQTPSAMSYNSGTQAWAYLTSTNAAPIETNKGYFLYIRGSRAVGVSTSTGTVDATVLRTTGTLYQGDNNAAISIAAGKFEPMGNTYASAIDFTSLSKTGTLSNSFYVWDSKLVSGTQLGAYQTFVGALGFTPATVGGSYPTGVPNTTIESGETIMLGAPAGGGGTIKLVEAAKTTGNQLNPFRPAAQPAQFRTSLYKAGTTPVLADNNIVVFDNAYSNAADADDALKIAHGGENIDIVTEGKSLIVDARQPVTERDVIQYSLKGLAVQQYKLSFSTINMNTAGLTAFVEDKYLHTTTAIDLNSASEYSFTVEAGNAASSAADRLSVVFKKAVVAPVSEVKPAITVSPNPVEGAVANLRFSNQSAGKYGISLLSGAGQVIFTTFAQHAGGNGVHLLNLPSGLASGSYQLEVVAPDKTRRVQTLFINTTK